MSSGKPARKPAADSIGLVRLARHIKRKAANTRKELARRNNKDARWEF